MKEPFEIIGSKTARTFLKKISHEGPYFGAQTLHTFSTGDGKPTWVFRGHSDAEYVLLPSALRRDARLLLTGGWKVLKEPVKQGDQAGAEYSSLAAFYWAADEQGLPVPEDSQELRSFFDPAKDPPPLGSLWEKNEPWLPSILLSLAALAQHHGLPTRLLDWSYNPYVAAYFAASGCAKNASKQLCVWALDLSVLSLIQDKHGSKGFLRFVSAPRSGNPNLLAQDGLFTMYTPVPFNWDVPTVATPLDQVVARWTGVRDIPILIKFILAASEPPELIKLLRRKGISCKNLSWLRRGGEIS